MLVYIIFLEKKPGESKASDVKFSSHKAKVNLKKLIEAFKHSRVWFSIYLLLVFT
jgi:hypothetical protein